MANHIVLVPQKLLKNPPSVREGLSHAVEQQQRIYGCHLIQKAGVLLKLEAVSIASAQTILHRFFFRRSLKQFDVRRVATASLLLACKLEEDPRRVMHLIGVIWLLSQLEDQPKVELKEETLDSFIIDFDSQEYELFRMDVFRCERYILRELGFMVSQTLVHPHRYILQYIHALFKDNFLFTNQLSQKAWGYLNDSMRTTLCCEVQPAVIAVGSIFLAACDLGIPLPRETGWYELFDVSWEDVMKVCSTILSLYTLPLPSYVKLAEETKLVQRTPSSSNSSGAATSVRSASASNSTSSKSRTTHAKEELRRSAAAVTDNSANRTESLNRRESYKVASSNSRDHLTRQSSIVGKGDSAPVSENTSAGAAASGCTEKRSPASAGMVTGDDVGKTPQGVHAEATEYVTVAAGEKRSGRDEIPGKSAARFPRAQPRAPPPLKEWSHTSVRPNQELQATCSGRAESVSPSPGSSFALSSRSDMGGKSSSSSSRSTTSSSSSSGSSSSVTTSSRGGDEPGGAKTVSAGRLKYIHFSSSRASPSTDWTTRAGYSGLAGRGGSPCRKGGRHSEHRPRRNSGPSAPPSSGRSLEREERPRGRQSRFELPRYGNSVSTQVLPSLTPAGSSASDKEASGTRKDESSHSRSSHWRGSSSGNRTAAGGTSRACLEDEILGARDSEIAAIRSEARKKGGENGTTSHGAGAAGVLQTRNNVSFSRREKDDSVSHRASSGGVVSPRHPGSSHPQRLPRTAHSGSTAAFLTSTFSANYFGAGCASSCDADAGGGSTLSYERRQRSPAWSLRGSELLEDAASSAGDGEKRSVKRQRRPPSHA